MSGAKQKFGLPTGVWMLVGGLSALMLGYMLGGVLTTTSALDFLLPHVAVPVDIRTNNDGPVRATPTAPSVQTPTIAKLPSAPPGNIVLAVPVDIRTNNDGPVRATPTVPSVQTPTIAKLPSAPPGNIVLQVAAVEREDHARALANALKQKGFPAFVKVANADKFYRVQVGTYTDRQSAQPTILALKRQGLRVFIRPQ